MGSIVSPTCVADVRTMPRSRRHPQFNIENLPQSLRSAGIGYVHLPGLGGRRRPRPDSPNTGWRNPSFQGYADHMQTIEFAKDLARLMDLARTQRAAVMCAEAVPWRCHRRLIADALTLHGFVVEDLLSVGRCAPHKLTPWAHVDGTRLTYPPQ